MSNRRHKILVVEDDLNLRLTLTELLRIQGFTVVTARDGDEGYLQALAHQPDLVMPFGLIDQPRDLGRLHPWRTQPLQSL